MTSREGRSRLIRSPVLSSRWVGPPDERFDGRRFANLEGVDHVGPGELLRWLTNRERGPWERRPAEPAPPPPERVDSGAVRVTFVGHATCLVQLDGLNVLTDPVWAERLGPAPSLAGPRRFRPPGVSFDALPPIDLVLLSHNHYDHLCEPTMRRLAERDQPAVVTGLGNAVLLSRMGIEEAIELDWWEEVEVRGARVAFVPTKHFSGRGLTDRDATLWGGHVLELPSGRVYFGGDTGMGRHFVETRERYGAPDVALLPIGAFRPTWFMSRVHVSPEEAVVASEQLEARVNVAIHHGTFALADDGQDEPGELLQAALEARGADAPIWWTLTEGEGRELPAAGGAQRRVSV